MKHFGRGLGNRQMPSSGSVRGPWLAVAFGVAGFGAAWWRLDPLGLSKA